jgi:hypothetical protein
MKMKNISRRGFLTGTAGVVGAGATVPLANLVSAEETNDNALYNEISEGFLHFTTRQYESKEEKLVTGYDNVKETHITPHTVERLYVSDKNPILLVDAKNRIIEIQQKMSGKTLYSILHNLWKVSNIAITQEFPMIAITNQQFEFSNEWEIKRSSLLRNCGFIQKNHKYANIVWLNNHYYKDIETTLYRGYYGFDLPVAKWNPAEPHHEYNQDLFNRQAIIEIDKHIRGYYLRHKLINREQYTPTQIKYLGLEYPIEEDVDFNSIGVNFKDARPHPYYILYQQASVSKIVNANYMNFFRQ